MEQTKKDFERHILKKFNADLEQLRSRVLTMGGLVEEQLGDAITSLAKRDVALAEAAVAKDGQINQLEVDIDRECVGILALQHPAAGDLRMIFAVIKTITDLERIGDEAQRIAKQVVAFASNKQMSDDATITRMVSLGQFVQQMLRNSLDAFARLDCVAAAEVVATDQKTDDEYTALVRMLTTYLLEDPRHYHGVIELLWIARSLERIGDHATNIGEYTVYLVEGQDIRHPALRKQ